MKRHRRKLLAALAAVLPAVPALARQRTAPVLIETGSGSHAVEMDAFDYASYAQNGILEYGLAPGPALSPAPSSTYPRPAEVVAEWFLANNRAALMLDANSGDFERVSTEVQCDGSEVVTFRQLYNLTPVVTSAIRLTVRDQVVRYVTARFISDVRALPVCQVAPPTSDQTEIVYLPTETSTLVVVITIDQLTQGTVETTRNGCDGSLLGYRRIFKN